MINHTQEKIVNILNERMVDTKTLATMLGRGYDEMKVQSMVLTLARKGYVDKTKAALMLRGTNMVKFLNYSEECHLKGKVPVFGSRQGES